MLPKCLRRYWPVIAEVCHWSLVCEFFCLTILLLLSEQSIICFVTFQNSLPDLPSDALIFLFLTVIVCTEGLALRLFVMQRKACIGVKCLPSWVQSNRGSFGHAEPHFYWHSNLTRHQQLHASHIVIQKIQIQSALEAPLELRTT